MSAAKEQTSKSEEIQKTCGIVMPISSIDGCDAAHWSDVLDIISDAAKDAGFSANLVSNADDVGIIQGRIISNLYTNDVVVCDVSAKNPNVMFELGMRLAFDKPTIIIKDNKTSYTFDTSVIEHIEYPRDLRHSTVVAFKKKLAEKITATYEKSLNDPSYTTFLKHFGQFTVAKIEAKEIPAQEYILGVLKGLQEGFERLERNAKLSENNRVQFSRADRLLRTIDADNRLLVPVDARLPRSKISTLLKEFEAAFPMAEITYSEMDDERYLELKSPKAFDDMDRKVVRHVLEKFSPSANN